MAEIKFVSKNMKEADLLKRDRLPISKFRAWQIEKGSRTTYLHNVLQKYLEGCELWPKKRKLFNSLNIEVEEVNSSTRIYFRSKQVFDLFGDMSAADIEKMYEVINDRKRKLRSDIKKSSTSL
jgi:hypothetical protein